MTDFDIRNAKWEDIDTLARFLQAMAAETEGVELSFDSARQGVGRLFEEPHRGHYIVACRRGEPVGSLLVTREWSDWRNGEFWWIQTVYVHPKARRQGVYRRLYDHVKGVSAHTECVRGLRLYVEQDNERARRTYEALGMQRLPFTFYQQLMDR